jgi:hypothetical protein
MPEEQKEKARPWERHIVRCERGLDNKGELGCAVVILGPSLTSKLLATLSTLDKKKGHSTYSGREA